MQMIYNRKQIEANLCYIILFCFIFSTSIVNCKLLRDRLFFQAISQLFTFYQLFSISRMGNTCINAHQTFICTFSSNKVTHNATDFFLESAQTNDNPHHDQLNSKFLETKITASGELLRSQPLQSVKMVKTTSIGTDEDDIQDIEIMSICQYFIAKKHKTPTIKVSFADFVRKSKNKFQNSYQILQKIGAGSFGEVFKALDIKTNDIRAIKAIRKNKFYKHYQEIEILKSCDHPNIIQIYQIFEEQLYCYVVMEYCSGGSIIKLIQDKKYLYHQGEARTIVEQILSALVYLHQNGIVHLDIKLENAVFMESTRGENYTSNLKIIDFGNAKRVRYKVNNSFGIEGTTVYMPPEAFQGWYSYSFDIWSCGILLYILLCGSSPFKCKTKQQTIESIKSKEVNFSQPAWQTVSPQAKKLVYQLLNKDFRKRPTASQCLYHIWFQPCMKKPQTRKASEKFKKNLQKYYIINNFVSVVESYLSFIKMSTSQKNQIKQLFQAIDSKRRGFLCKKDISLYYQEVKQEKIDERTLTQLFEAIDKNKSGYIDYSQFLTAMSNRQKLFIKQSLKVAFDHFDTDKSGYIEKNELVYCLKNNISEVNQLIEQIDQDHDLKISKNQFLEYFDKIQQKLSFQ